MTRIVAILTLLVLPFAICAKKMYVVAQSDSQPLSGTILMSGNGTIVGMTDEEGACECMAESLPITVRCIGYKDQHIAVVPPDTVFLLPETYELSEIVVNPADRPILKLRCYIREYTTGTFGSATIQMFGEYMADYFLNDKKVKGFHKISTPYVRAKRARVRYKNSAGLDSIAKPSDTDEFLSWIDLCSINPHRRTMADSVMNGATETVMGKYKQFSTCRINNNRLVYSRDILANYKGHHWSPWFLKLIGFTIDASEMRSKDVFLIDDKGNYGPHSLQMATYTMEMTIKSKFIKKAFHTKEPIKSFSTVEVYPLEAQYLTVKEAKDLEWDYSQRTIEQSPLAPELPANIKEMLEHTQSH